ncbi:unnamed protein product [Allacma fusca]|uniref:Uncharacterized protein n=1 Tax=Allacma fusca TaxID=39272 RepID=A0A8J2P2C4_9HEXA|nr:unnamed protein product [Allacma fusca]
MWSIKISQPSFPDDKATQCRLKVVSKQYVVQVTFVHSNGYVYSIIERKVQGSTKFKLKEGPCLHQQLSMFR